MSTLKSIQALRAVAATLVLLCHLFAIDQQTAKRTAPMTSFWENGAYGVDLFFVISGFVIVWVGAERRQAWRSAANFIAARVVRIYPTWWLFAGLMAIALWLTGGVPWNVERMADWGMHGPSHLWHSFLLLPQAHHPVLGVGWTLVHEMYFYVVFAALICFVPIKRRPLALWFWTALVLLGALCGFADEFAKDWIALVFYPMTLEFCAGAFVAYLIKSGFMRYGRICFWLGSLGFVAVFFGADQAIGALFGLDLQILHVWQRTLTYGVCAAVLVYGAVALELSAPREMPIPTSLVRLGDWSYALYLCHPLVISVTGRVGFHLWGFEGWLAPYVVLAVSLIASVALSGIVYATLERPLIARFKRWQASRRTPSQAARD
ncbi:MAG: acyltransferase [Pseudomonadota bacterium]